MSLCLLPPATGTSIKPCTLFCPFTFLTSELKHNEKWTMVNKWTWVTIRLLFSSVLHLPAWRFPGSLGRNSIIDTLHCKSLKLSYSSVSSTTPLHHKALWNYSFRITAAKSYWQALAVYEVQASYCINTVTVLTASQGKVFSIITWQTRYVNE